MAARSPGKENNLAHKVIEDIEALDKLVELDAVVECFVFLRGGARSSKVIQSAGDDMYYIFNEIDGSEEELTKEQLMQGIIGDALNGGALYQYA